MELSCVSAGSSSLTSSETIRMASDLPNSTPYWSNESMCQITPGVKMLCSYRAASLPSVAEVNRSIEASRRLDEVGAVDV